MFRLTQERKDGRTELVTLANPRAAAAEAFRTLRTNIQFSSLDAELRTLLVTSAGPEEGKSTVLANLAVTMAEAGRQVLMVDSDLRHPRLHTLFALEASPGFTDVVVAAGTSAMPLQQTAVPGLRLLAAGPLPPNPSELLSSSRVPRVLEALKQQAEIVLFDSPPLLAVTDAAVLASRVDGVLLVVSAGRTKRDLARRSRQQLDKVNARVLGVVLNNVRATGGGYRYYSPAS